MRDLLSLVPIVIAKLSHLRLSLFLFLLSPSFRPLFLSLPPLLYLLNAQPPPNLQPSPGSRLFEDYESFQGRATAPSYAPAITGTPAPNSPPFRLLRRGISNANILSLSVSRLEFFAGISSSTKNHRESAVYNLQIEYA